VWTVRDSTIYAAFQVAKKFPAFAIEVAICALSNDAPSELVKHAIQVISESNIPWEAIPNELIALGNILLDHPDYTVRGEAAALITSVASRSRLVGAALLPRLLQDKEVLVRAKALNTFRDRDLRLIAGEALESDDRAQLFTARRKVAVCKWVMALTDAKLSTLTWKEGLQRALRNFSVAALAIFLIFPLLHLVPLSLPQVSTLDFHTIAVGLVATAMSYYVARWIDMYFYSRHALLLLRWFWPLHASIVFVVVLAIVGLRSPSLSSSYRDRILIGLVIAMAGAISAVERWLNKPRELWPGFSAFWIAGIGIGATLLAVNVAAGSQEAFLAHIRYIPVVLLTLVASPARKRTVAQVSAITVALACVAYVITTMQPFDTALPIHRVRLLESRVDWNNWFLDDYVPIAMPPTSVMLELNGHGVYSADSALRGLSYSPPIFLAVLVFGVVGTILGRHDDAVPLAAYVSGIASGVVTLVAIQSWMWAVVVAITFGPALGAVFAVLRSPHRFWPISSALCGTYVLVDIAYHSGMSSSVSLASVFGIAVVYLFLWRGSISGVREQSPRIRMLSRGMMLSLCAAPVGYGLCIVLGRLFAILLDRHGEAGIDTTINMLSAIGSGAAMSQLFGSGVQSKRSLKWTFLLTMSGVTVGLAMNAANGDLITASACLVVIVMIVLVRLFIVGFRAPWLVGIAGGLAVQNLYLVYVSRYFHSSLPGFCSVLLFWIVALQVGSWRYPEFVEWVKEIVVMKPLGERS
jgi:hypothetical protein